MLHDLQDVAHPGVRAAYAYSNSVPYCRVLIYMSCFPIVYISIVKYRCIACTCADILMIMNIRGT